jgi:hypothetical protein
MLLSLLFSLVGVVAAASVPRLPKLDAVGNVSCTPIMGAAGTLTMQTGLPLQSPVPVSLVNNTLQENNGTQPFLFHSCISTFMNTTDSQMDGVAVHYG